MSVNPVNDIFPPLQRQRLSASSNADDRSLIEPWKRRCAWKAHNAFHFSTATTTKFCGKFHQGLLRREGDETTVQRRDGKPNVDNVSLESGRFIRTATRGSSSSARRVILHLEAGYIYVDCYFANLKPLAVRRRTIHYQQSFFESKRQRG